MRIYPFVFVVALLLWTGLGGGYGCGCPPGTTLINGQCISLSCLDNTTDVESVPAGTREYDFTEGRAAKGDGQWLGLLSDGIDFNGSGPACWVNGTFDGQFPENIAYECTSTHNPSQCVCYDGGYHTTSGMRPNGPDPSVIEDVAIKNYGDGISVGPNNGDVIVRRVFFENIHDDAIESDYGQQSISCTDCLFDKVFMVQAYKRRSSVDDPPKPELTMELRNSLVRLHRFTCSYKMKPGHGGVYKDDDFLPKFIVTDNVFVLGPVVGSGQKLWPTDPVECRNNVVLWLGTQLAWDSVKSGMPTNCYRVVIKDANETEEEFLNRGLVELGGMSWNDKVAQWKANHVAGK